MELKDMTLSDVEARISELAEAVNSPEQTAEQIDAMTEELKGLNERKAELHDIEERKADAKALEENEVSVTEVEVKEERKGEIEMKSVEEVRNSAEYIDAFANFIKTGKDEECRSLLTTNVDGGTIAVPDIVLAEVKTAWDANEIMSLVRTLEVKGNIKVQFEISGDDAVIHTEGSGAVAEESLSMGIVTLVPSSIKKWISISDEVEDMRSDAFITYIYRELTYKITKKLADTLVGKIAALTTADSTHVSATTIKKAIGMSTIAEAIANLSDDASNPVIVMNKLTFAEFKKVQYANGYGADPFEGLRVIFNNSLPAYTSATENQIFAIVGDFGYGALANFPSGRGISIKYDDLTKKEYDLVEILGRQYVAVEPVACKAFTLLAKPAAV